VTAANAANAAAADSDAPTIIPVWKAVDDDTRRELVEMWTGTGAITDRAVAAVRAGQAVCIARDADGALCGVATAVRRVFPRLRQPMYYYRQYFAPSIRGRRHATAFLNESRRVLEAYNAALPRPECLGVLVELENPQLAAIYDRVVIPEVGMTFIGYSARGLQLRAAWFDGARLMTPLPASLPRLKPNPARLSMP
jgi:hypothetical protein